ncbi:DUF11 domain-containing protein, partial [Pontibacter toksunensis]
TARNAGPGAAEGVVVTENIPDGLTLVSAVTLKGTYDQSANKWAVGALANNESAVLTLVFTITKPGTLVNGVTVVADNTDPVPGDNSSEAPINVPLPPANVSVVKAAVAGQYAVGGRVSYTVTARNAGPGAAEGVVVTENIPDGLTLVSAVTLKGTYDQSTSKWAVGALANNESAVLTLVFTITKPGTLVNG